MGFQIESATGNGAGVGVTDENMMKAESVIIDIQHHVNHDHGEVYSIVVDKTPTGAGDCFLYIKNNDDDPMVVTSIKLQAATDETVLVKVGDTGTAAGGTTNTPANRNAGSGNIADITCQDGVDITGLSGGSTVDQLVVDGGVGSVKHAWVSNIIVPKNKVLTLYASSGAIAIKATVSIHFHNG